AVVAIAMRVYNDEKVAVLILLSDISRFLLGVILQYCPYTTFILSHHPTMSTSASWPSSRGSSITVAARRPQSRSQRSCALIAALKKPFQGWSKELLRARDHDDDDYNFASGRRRGFKSRNYEAGY
ncbi:hypothetical protein JI435_018520, partial [Parastagonospora nodorum SN15]